MRKLLAICLAIMMVAGMSVTAFAASGSFMDSPSGKPAPEVVEFDSDSDDCTAELVVTPYSERDELPDDKEKLLEDAYDDIVGTDDLTELNDDLKELAKDKDIDGEDLAVSDLFNLHDEGCDENHDEHSPFDVVLEADTLNNFVGLLYMDEDGKWHLVKGAEVVNGNHLKFVTDAFGPFAIVVDGSKKTPSQTGDDSLIGLYIAVMAISAVAIVVIAVKSKKQRV